MKSNNFSIAKFFVFASIFTALSFSVTFVSAATFYWTQTTWSGGLSADQANHLNNQTGWTFYSVASSTYANSSSQIQLIRETNGVN